MKQKTAIILGATGLTGNLLLNQLVCDDDYVCVKLFSRRTLNHTSPKIKEFVGDLLHLEQFKNEFKADVVFCCLGTTAAKTKDRTMYKAIDYGIPVAAAKLAKANNIKTFVAISALGADKNSKVFYNKIKGEMESAVLGLQIPKVFILRPSLIVGTRDKIRFGEVLAGVILKLTSIFLVGKLKKYRLIKAEVIATAMRLLDKKSYSQIIINSDIIKQLSKGY